MGKRKGPRRVTWRLGNVIQHFSNLSPVCVPCSSEDSQTGQGCLPFRPGAFPLSPSLDLSLAAASTHTFTRTCTYARTHIHAHVHIRTHTHSRTHAHTHTHTFTHTCTYARTSMTPIKILSISAFLISQVSRLPLLCFRCG